MRQLKALSVAALALALSACSPSKFLVNPFSSKAAAYKVREPVRTNTEMTTIKPVTWGSFVSPVEGEYFKPVLPTDSRNALIYVYRPQSDWNDQELQSPGFFINGRHLSGLKSGSYFWFEIPASSYYFYALRPFAFLYLTTVFEADVSFEGGKSYYFRYDEERPGPEKPIKGAALLVMGPLQQMPPAQGLREIAQTRSMGAGSVMLADVQPKWAPFDFYPNPRPVPASSLDNSTEPPRKLNLDTKQ